MLIFAIIGFSLLLVAYVLCLFGSIRQEGSTFNLLNFFGAVLLAYHVYKYDGLMLTSIPLLWALVSLYYLFAHGIIKGKKNKKR